MYDGITLERFNSLPPAERAGLFSEDFLETAYSEISDPEGRELADILIRNTVVLATGVLSPRRRLVALTEIKSARNNMFSNPNSKVGGVAEEYVWATAFYFLREIKAGTLRI